MILKAKEREITIQPKIKNIIELTNTLKGKNLNEVYFKGSTDNNLETLCLILRYFGVENEKRAFNSNEEVYVFLDDYMTESQDTVADIYRKIAEVINDMGFFNKKMSQEELKTSLETNLDINMDAIVTDIVKKVTEEQMKPEIEKEFKGFKA